MGFFFAPWVFFFLKGFTVVFDSKKIFFEQKKFEKKNFWVKNNSKSFEKKKKNMGQTDLSLQNYRFLQSQFYFSKSVLTKYSRCHLPFLIGTKRWTKLCFCIKEIFKKKIFSFRYCQKFEGFMSSILP